jgi:molecular chaperone GrpE (heat shock protein)
MFEEESEEYDSGIVTQVFQVGYTLKKRLLRPAMVVVSKKKS